MRTVPNVIGIAADATGQLTGLGFTVTQTSQANGTSQGTVVGQSSTGPAAIGSTIVLDVSTGQAPAR